MTAKKIIFLHPDLGIGGAERLIVDAALAFQKSGHKVHIVTNHHDKNRCFSETIDELSVQVIASWFPRSLFGRAIALCAYIRLTLAAFYLILFGNLQEQTKQPNAIFVDQISAPLPFFHLFRKQLSNDKNLKIVFYGHFPDQLLATNRSSFVTKLYRSPIDWFEQWSTGFADVLLVNSKFTERVFRKTFPSLANAKMQVVYPACNFASLDSVSSDSNDEANWTSKSTVFLSLNRYERKKNIGLAIQALSELIHTHSESNVELIIAGGYDVRVQENVEHEIELKQLAQQLKIEHKVTFLRSPSDAKKVQLLKSCHVLLYTPENEHFGIVPLEAMYCSRPVISCASGGPLETIVNEQTGYHCESGLNNWAETMKKLHSDHDLAKQLGENGRDRVLQHFAFTAFQRQLNECLD